jgi:hypothetical protein
MLGYRYTDWISISNSFPWSHVVSFHGYKLTLVVATFRAFWCLHVWTLRHRKFRLEQLSMYRVGTPAVTSNAVTSTILCTHRDNLIARLSDVINQPQLSTHSRHKDVCSATCKLKKKVRSEEPRGLRHEMPSLAQPLESWAQIPLDALMFVCLCSLFVHPVFATRWSTVQRVLPTLYNENRPDSLIHQRGGGKRIKDNSLLSNDSVNNGRC